jgi:plastocyanin
MGNISSERSVQSIRSSISKAFFIVAALWLLAPRHASGQAGPHVVLVKMVDKPNGQFAFEPAALTAQRGDTVRFLQSSTAPHNIHFRKMPKGAKLGAAASSPYLMGEGKKYDVVVDSRFVDGTYEFICDPHESVGMTGTLTVVTPAK